MCDDGGSNAAEASTKFAVTAASGQVRSLASGGVQPPDQIAARRDLSLFVRRHNQLGIIMISRILITVVTFLYGIAPLFADLNMTHVLHPEWTPHSRFHMVWLLGTNTSIAVLALWLLWSRAQLVLSAVLGLCVMTGFWFAVATRGLYGGTLADVGGIETRILGVEGNSFLFGLIVVMLFAALLMRPKKDDV